MYLLRSIFKKKKHLFSETVPRNRLQFYKKIYEKVSLFARYKFTLQIC